MNLPPKLCLVEDDVSIRALLSERLRREGYEVDVFENAEAYLASRREWESWDLFIFDVLLSGEYTGLDLCTKLRKGSRTIPVLFVSALSEPMHRIEGLKVGADDYIGKPFEVEELLLRVKGILRRQNWYHQQSEVGSILRWGENEVDLKCFQARVGKREFAVTEKECMLIKMFFEKKGEVIGRSDILDKVWGYNVFPSSRTVDNFILRLRKQFEPDPQNPIYFHSIRGIGYKFTP